MDLSIFFLLALKSGRVPVMQPEPYILLFHVFFLSVADAQVFFIPNDVLTCGVCDSKFTDIALFIAHKSYRTCNLLQCR